MSNAGNETSQTDKDDMPWNDKICYQIAMQKKFPSTVRTPEIQKKVIENFLNFYVSGKPEKGLSVSDIVFAVIAILPKSLDDENLAWNDREYDDKGDLFFTSAYDKVNYNEAKLNNPTCDVMDFDTSQTSGNLDWSTETNEIEKSIFSLKHNDSFDFDTNQSYLDSDWSMEMDEATTSIYSYENEATDDFEFCNETLNEIEDDLILESPHRNNMVQHRRMNDIPQLIPNQNKWFFRKPDNKPTIAEVKPTYGPSENSAFISHCNMILKNWDTNSSLRNNLKMFFGVISLTSLRAATKSYKHLFNVFSSPIIFVKIFDHLHNFKYCSPHKRFVKVCFKVFSKKDKLLRIMFAKIVNLTHENSLSLTSTIMSISVLGHTADFGLGIVNMLRTIVTNNEDIEKLQHVTVISLPETALSWKRLIEFLNSFAFDKNQKSFRWSKIIEPNCFKSVTCAQNQALAVVFGVLVEKTTKDDTIWRSHWTSAVPEDVLAEYKLKGLEIYNQMRKQM